MDHFTAMTPPRLCCGFLLAVNSSGVTGTTALARRFLRARGANACAIAQPQNVVHNHPPRFAPGCASSPVLTPLRAAAIRQCQRSANGVDVEIKAGAWMCVTARRCSDAVVPDILVRCSLALWRARRAGRNRRQSNAIDRSPSRRRRQSALLYLSAAAGGAAAVSEFLSIRLAFCGLLASFPRPVSMVALRRFAAGK